MKKIKLLLVVTLIILIVWCMKKGKEKYSIYQKRKIPKKFKEELFKNIINDILYEVEEKGVMIWLNYGTLLGQVRNKSIIPYDYDIDFGARGEDVELIADALSNLDEEKYTVRYINYLGIKQHIVYEIENDIEVDISYFKEIGIGTGNESIKRINIWDSSRLKWKIDDIFPLKKDILNDDTPVYIPNKPEVILETYYGKNWIEPNIKSSSDGEYNITFDPSDFYTCSMLTLALTMILSVK